MSDQIPHNAFVVVADGAGARFFRNSGHPHKVSLTTDGDFEPSLLTGDGPAGKQPSERTRQETDEATFAKQLAHELNRRALRHEFDALVLIADPQTLGQIRPLLHNEVSSRLSAEYHKTLTGASIAEIQKALS
jgi:protein required for attachment to host cells